VSASSSEGSVPLNWLLSIALRAAAAKSVLSTVLPPPPLSVHGISRRGTHNISSFVIAPSSEGSVPLNWLSSKSLRAAAKSALSTVLPPPPPSVHGTSRRGTHNISTSLSSPTSEGSVPLSWLLFKFLRAAAAASSAQSSRRRLSLSPWHLKEGALTIPPAS
jgi:hypothetical protein